MSAKNLLSIFLSLAVFVIGASAIYFFGAQQRTNRPELKSEDKIANIEGLNEGDLVNLPTLTSITGETISLNLLKEKTVLCVFFTPTCAGCAKDIELWKDLHAESTNRGVAFFIIDVGTDREALKKFVAAYKLQNLPVLSDPNHKVGPALKINFVPEYLLFANGGKVLHRWDGVRNYDQAKDRERVGEFFRFSAD
ncbi:MAG TPA: TlpA disulfide reductase family protein [Pyrinomonadaceae bacterium]|nr:TlpA disulfide reductase family protein [Pyrinomonadaceae bacterium]